MHDGNNRTLMCDTNHKNTFCWYTCSCLHPWSLLPYGRLWRYHYSHITVRTSNNKRLRVARIWHIAGHFVDDSTMMCMKTVRQNTTNNSGESWPCIFHFNNQHYVWGVVDRAHEILRIHKYRQFMKTNIATRKKLETEICLGFTTIVRIWCRGWFNVS